MWILIIAALLAIISYYFVIRPHQYWKRNGVSQGNPHFLVGDAWNGIVGKESPSEVIRKWYNSSPNSRYFGLYEFLKPILLIRDPDLIRQITIKDFDHFPDHRQFIPEDVDPLWAKNLFSLKGQRWHDMRSTLSPAFTSSKMKHMFSLMAQIGEQFVKHFLAQNKDLITIELKDTFTRFTTDVIGSTAFGVVCDSLGQPENEFYMMGKESADFLKGKKFFTVFGYILIPKVMRLFNFKIFSSKLRSFFNNLISETISVREKHNTVRPDMIQLLIEARKRGLKYEESENTQDTGFATVQESDIGKKLKNEKMELSDEDITAQAFLFFLGGFDTVSSLMCFMSYELGANPDIQERLRQEVDETSKRCQGKITYNALTAMKYMDMVTSESLRKWPNMPFVDRACSKPYTIQPERPNEKPVHLGMNDIITIPIYALHRDPQYFPDPDRFDPERFSDENKKQIQPFTYIPFGSGPRNCIGSRFALLEAKILLFYILSHFEIVPTEKTQIPVKLHKTSFTLASENGLWFGLKRRAK